MASITKKSNGTWLAQVRHKAKNGRPAVNLSATFDRKADAAAWAARIEEEWKSVRLGLSPRIPFRDVLERYLIEITPKKRGARSETYRLKNLMDSDLAMIPLPDLSDLPFREWIKQRQTEVSTDSVLREWTTLSHVLTVAVKEWRLLPENYLFRLQKPKAAPPRTRRVTDDEIGQICWAAGYSEQIIPEKQVQRVAAAFCFALETGMRAGEIVAMTRDEVFWERHFVHLPKTKNGLPRDVPLSERALRILQQVSVSHENQRIFGLSSSSLDAQFRKLKKQVSIENLHFHDSRREALTRLAKIYSPMELAKISGHKDLRILLNTYYAPTAEELAVKMR